MFKRIPAMAAMDNAVSVIDVPATVKVNPSAFVNISLKKICF